MSKTKKYVDFVQNTAKYGGELKPLRDTVVSLDWRMTGISEARYHNDPERGLRLIDEKKLRFGFMIRPFEK